MHERVLKKFVAVDSYSLQEMEAPSELKIKLELDTEVEMAQGSVVIIKKNSSKSTRNCGLVYRW